MVHVKVDDPATVMSDESSKAFIASAKKFNPEVYEGWKKNPDYKKFWDYMKQLDTPVAKPK